MKRAKRPTKRELKAQRAPVTTHENTHIHCIACGRHLNPNEFSASPASAKFLTCQHGSTFATCTGCTLRSQQLIDEHDRSNQPVKSAAAWH
ncbi:MAG TPA: hypothetical protein VL137_10315 [Polyangiaceae bacterium]|jgi:hypothetical protein|nr:hypothetical protein [Polyangiaceae bacterium]